jgi:uncharacterized membrane protein YhaH (DUF805 family)
MGPSWSPLTVGDESTLCLQCWLGGAAHAVHGPLQFHHNLHTPAVRASLIGIRVGKHALGRDWKMEIVQDVNSRGAKRTGEGFVVEEQAEGGVDEAFNRSMASLSLQLATRFAEGPRPMSKSSEKMVTRGAAIRDLLFNFRGRANRAKFWIAALGLLVVDLIALLGSDVAMAHNRQEAFTVIGSLAGIALVVVLAVVAWISLAVTVKRFHDRDKSGWWVLIVFVPVIGGLWYLIECGFLRGTDGHNSFGSDPLARY